MQPMTSKLKSWERGIAVESNVLDPVTVYLWFSEWHLFAAVDEGEHTRGHEGQDATCEHESFLLVAG